MVTTNPVLVPGITGSWDDWRTEFPAVIKVGDTLKMWYIGSRQDYSKLQVGYSWSLDGEDWHKYSGNPVLNKGRFRVKPDAIKFRNLKTLFFLKFSCHSRAGRSPGA